MPLVRLLLQVFYMKPHYILFIHLVLNDMIHLTTTVCLFVFSYTFYKISTSFCCLIITFAVLATLNTPFNLAVMAVECYIAVCLPLRHAQLCTIKSTYILVGSIWAISAVSTLPDVLIVLVTEPLHVFYSTIFCDIYNMFPHPINLKKREVMYSIYLIVVWLILFYTYIKIFIAAKKADSDVKKARNTVLLHGFQLLLCMLTYVGHLINKSLFYLFPKHHLHVVFTSFIIIQMLPRFISPIVYGLRDKTLRQHLRKYLPC